MSAFKPKRVSGADLVGQISGVTQGLPDVAGSNHQAAPSTPAAKAPATVQVNFKASPAFAELIAIEAEKAGSTRRLFARLMRQTGHEVPDADVSPPDTRRRRQGES